jgi:hypothetical protein
MKLLYPTNAKLGLQQKGRNDTKDSSLLVKGLEGAEEHSPVIVRTQHTLSARVRQL